MINSQFKAVLRQRKGIIYQGKVAAVTAINDLGVFDILENHANFVTIIKEKIVLVHNQGYRREFKLDSGILSVRDNQVDVFFGV